MKLFINGEESDVDAASVAALIGALDLDPRKVAIELNLEIVPRSRHLSTPLAPGDRVEIVQFVGGG